jgi:hypothetical protein
LLKNGENEIVLFELYENGNDLKLVDKQNLGEV